MNLSNEKKLLFLCAQKNTPQSTCNQIKHLISLPINWEEVLDYAFSDNTAPLLYYKLKNIGGSNYVPHDVMKELTNAYHENVARNMYLYSELQRILKVFDENNINVMVLKGAALADTVYGDIGLRSFGDLDLLLKEEELFKAKEIMLNMDYVNIPDTKPEEWYKKNHFHLPPYMHKEKSIIVELHWNVESRFGISIDNWWRRARIEELANYKVLVPSPEDMLIHLCIQLHYQNYNEEIIKRGICDICETLRYYQKAVDWDLFLHEINSYEMAKAVYAILYLIEKYYEHGDNSLIQIKLDNYNVEFLKILENKILLYSTFPGPFIKYYTVDGIWDKARSVIDGVFPDSEAMAGYYSLPMTSKKLYFYYLVRPFQLLIKYRSVIYDIFSFKKNTIEN